MKVTNNMINPQIRTLGKIVRLMDPLSSEKKLRKLSPIADKFFVGRKIKGISIESVYIDRSNDHSKLRVCVLKAERPRNEKVPGVLWLHGGGYAIGAAEMAGMSMPKRFMEQSGCVVVSPDYRLSVEEPYPAALYDAYDALLWMKRHAQELGIDDSHLIVGGESAGGGLTAALCMYARDKGEVAISLQIPLYPMLDDRMETESQRDNDAPVWNVTANRAGWKLYLGELSGTDKVPCYASPARATDFANLPPAISFVGSVEPFRDETIQYFKALKKEGIPTAFRVYKGGYHAFSLLQPKADISKQAVEFVLKQYTYAIKHYAKEQIKN